MQMHIIGKADGHDPLPCTTRQVRIMIAGYQMPGHGRKAAHDLEWLRKGFRVRSLLVIDVARNQHRPRVLGDGELADLGDRIQPRLLQERHDAIAGKSEDLADMPIGCVDQTQGTVLPGTATILI